MTRTACPTCTRRLRLNEAGMFLCPRCGTVGKAKPDGTLVWDRGGDGSPESRQARTAWKHDGHAEMRASDARGLGL